LPDFHRRLLSDGGALYTTTALQEEIGADRWASAILDHDLVTRRFFARRCGA